MMTKYGQGLNKEISKAVKSGEILEPFGIAEVRSFIIAKGWEIPDTYINVCLANGASGTHSLTYKKYFKSVGDGKYVVVTTE
jgi:hypothetical protein